MLTTIKFNKIIKNGIWLYILQFFNTVIPLVTLPYVTRILGVSNYGIFAFALNLVGYIVVIVEYGFNMTGSRKVAISCTQEQINVMFTLITIIRTVLFLICGLCIYMCIILLQRDSIQSTCIAILMIMVVGVIFDQSWIFQGKQQMNFITIISLIARSTSIILIFLLVKNAQDLYLYCFLYSIVQLLMGLIGTAIVFHKFHVRFCKIARKIIIKEMKEGWYLFTTTLSSKVFATIGITLLGFFSTEYLCGIYSVLYKIPSIFILIWSPIGQILFPIASSELEISYSQGMKLIKRVKKIVLLFFLILIVVFSIFAYPIIYLLLGSEYSNYYYTVYPLLIWVILSINNNFLGTQMLVAAGYSKDYSSCFQIGVIIMIIVNLIGVWFGGIMGVAIAPAISEFALGILLRMKVYKIENNSRNSIMKK